MNENVIDKIKKEIEKTGFPLELRVAEFLTRRDYYVAHSLYYIDEEENKSREVDLRALHNTEIKNVDGKTKHIRNCLLIECKKSANKPWIFLSSSNSSYDPAYYDLPSLPSVNVLSFEEWDHFEKIHPFCRYNVLGRSYFEAFKNNESSEMIFKALTTAVKATLYTMKSEFGIAGDDLCYYYPLIVFDGDIFQAELRDGQITVEQVDSVLVSFLYKSPTYKSGEFAVPVLKESALPDFLEKIEKANRFVADIVQYHINSKNIDWSEILKNGIPI